MNQITNEMISEAGVIWWDEHWRIEDGEPGWLIRDGVRRQVDVTLWWLMCAIRYGVGCKVQQELNICGAPVRSERS